MGNTDPKHRPAGAPAGARRPTTDELAAARAKANAEAGAAAAGTSAPGDAQHLADGLPPQERHRVLEDEAAAIAAEFAEPGIDPEPAAGELSPEAVAQGYLILAKMIVGQGAALAVPNWHVTIEETDDLSKALVECLMLWFPDGVMPPKYMAIVAVAGVGARIALSRRDPHTGDLPPRHAPPPPPPTAPPPPPGTQHIAV